MSAVNRAADAVPDTLRVSLDAKATVKIGPFSRKGRSRVSVAAADHDFQPAGTVTPVGLLLPELDELFLYAVTSRVTSDCLVDRLAQWWEAVRARFPHYPPYHSKYNPVERCWGVLEQHWNGTLLAALDTVLQFAATMTWKGTRPTVTLVTTTYERGVTLTKEAMATVEAQLIRHPTLGKWFVDIRPPRPERDT